MWIQKRRGTLANDDREIKAHNKYLVNGEYTCVGCKSIFTYALS